MANENELRELRKEIQDLTKELDQIKGRATPGKTNMEWAWTFEKHAADTAASRTNFFLVAQAFLITTFIAVRQGKDPEVVFRVVISILGMIYTLSWLYVNARLGQRLPLLKPYLKWNPIFRIYNSPLPADFEKPWWARFFPNPYGPPAWSILDRFVPATMAIVWAVAFAYTLMPIRIEMPIKWKAWALELVSAVPPWVEFLLVLLAFGLPFALLWRYLKFLGKTVRSRLKRKVSKAFEGKNYVISVMESFKEGEELVLDRCHEDHVVFLRAGEDSGQRQGDLFIVSRNTFESATEEMPSSKRPKSKRKSR